MLKAPIPPDELKRQRELDSYNILDTAYERSFDRITKLAAKICQTKISLISLIDSDRQWFKSRFGLEAQQTPRDVSYCGHAILGDDLFVVENADQDERFRDNPLCTGQPLVKFYAGMPLKTSNGYKLGTLCVIDHEPKVLSDYQRETLSLLADQVISLLETRRTNEFLLSVYDQYQSVQVMAKTGGWELDCDTSTVKWSNEIYRIYQIPLATPVNKIDGLSYYPLHERERLQQLLDDAIKQGKSYDGEFEFKDATGKLKWVRTQGRPVYVNGVIKKIVGTFQDITDYKHAQLLLMAQQAENAAYVSGLNATAIVSKTDASGVITEANQRLCEISGYSREEIVGKTHRIFKSNEHSLSFFQELWETILAKKVWRGEIKNKNKNGGHFWLDTTITPLLDSQGELNGFLTIRYDITEKKNRDLMDLELNKIHELFIKNSQNPRNFFNETLASLISLTGSEYGFIGKIHLTGESRYLQTYAITDISWSEDTKKFYQDNFEKGLLFKNHKTLFGEVLKTEKAVIANDVARDPRAGGIPAGHPELKRFLGVPIFYQDRFIAMIGVANRKSEYTEKLLFDLAPILDSLGEMLNLRSVEEELDLQKKISFHNAKLASLGQLAAGVGHEINNPLAIVSGQLEVIEGLIDESPVKVSLLKERLPKIQNAIVRIRDIVKGLKVFSRSDKELFSDVEMVGLVAETISMLRELYAKDGVTLSFVTNLDKAHISGSRGRIQQVLVNLISNAKDACLKMTHPKIDVGLTISNGALYVEVKDNGVGIPQEIHDKIFEPFFTTKPVNEGTGIGLSLVNTIVQEHGGKIEFTTVLGTGTLFKVTLPLSTTGLESVENLERKPSSSTKINRVVYVIDDEPDLRDVLAYLIGKYCSRVETFSNATEALKSLQDKKVDLVISDIMMPVMDGFGFVKELEKLSLKQLPKVMFVSGGVDFNKNQLEIVSTKTAGVLSKPFSKDEIETKLGEIFPADFK